MDNGLLEEKVDNLLDDFKKCIESKSLTEHEIVILENEIDKLLYECLYYKSKLIC